MPQGKVITFRMADVLIYVKGKKNNVTKKLVFTTSF